MAEGTILLVEDDASVLATMQAILELEGYAVMGAPDGELALGLLREHTYDVVVTDLRMEGVDGITVLAEARRTAPDTSTILLTGYASLESAIRALQEGAYAYLIKPCDVEELKATVSRAAERRQLRRQLRTHVRELEDANATIRELNAGLEARIAEATAELAARNAALAEARDEIASLYEQAKGHVDQLQQLDRLKSAFLSMAAHELKTPLTSIYGYLQVAQRRAARRRERGLPTAEEWKQDGDVDQQQWDTLVRQTQRLSRLVDELLDVSRIQTGKLELRSAPVDLPSLVADVTSHMQLTTEQHEIVFDAMGDGCLVQGDHDRLEQVLTNLLSNAIKYSPEGGPIRVTLGADREQAVLRVQDRGIGIPSNERQAIFDMFYRSDEWRSRQAGGMGIGLYISKEIVQRHGGAIWVESAPGGGSIFVVSLPCRVAGDGVAPEAGPARPATA